MRSDGWTPIHILLRWFRALGKSCVIAVHPMVHHKEGLVYQKQNTRLTGFFSTIYPIHIVEAIDSHKKLGLGCVDGSVLVMVGPSSRRIDPSFAKRLLSVSKKRETFLKRVNLSRADLEVTTRAMKNAG